jgi:DNA polymerase-4
VTAATGERTILHLDMDAFFASVELLRHPELRGRPVVVGGDGSRGVVAAASYEARSYGVYSAMGSVRARKLCPDAVFLHGDHAHYSEVSGRIMAILRDVTPLVEPLSLDEAFLDVTGVLHGQTDGATIARQLRERIADAEGLDCAVGVAPSKFVAKLASKGAKPRVGRPGAGPTPGIGVLVITAADQLGYLRALPVQAMWGVGPATYDRLAALGVRTIGDLGDLPVDTLVRRIGRAAGAHLHALAHGIDPRPVVPDHAPKSIGHEATYPIDHTDRSTLLPELARLADATARRLHEQETEGRTLTLKVRFADFRTITRAASFDQPTASAREISRTARRLLEAIDVSVGVRLLGVSMSGLAPSAGARQLSLDDVDAGSWAEAERTIEEIRDRFGADAIAPAALIEADRIGVRTRGDQQWGKADPDRR